MTAKRLSMRKIKEVLRLVYYLGLSVRQVARSCQISHSTVLDYIRRAKAEGLNWSDLQKHDDYVIEQMLFPVCKVPRQTSCSYPDFNYINKELRRKGVTLQLLWTEYKSNKPEGIQYSRFCELYRQWSGKLDVVMRQHHRAGEKLFVDFAGTTIDVIDPKTGEIEDAQIFVAVMGASNYTYAVALKSQSLPEWIKAHIQAFEFFGGIPEIIVPDNLKSGVSKACRYEPDINPTYHDMACHYGTAVIPARVRKPRDKAKVEVGVQVVTRWITAALRKHTFFSIEVLNCQIRERLDILNTRQFKKLSGNRLELFRSIDRPALKPLPDQKYTYADWKKAKVNVDYHIELEGHLYSVPYQLTGKRVEARITADMVEIFHQSNRITLHRRIYKSGFSTIEEHMPKAHQKQQQWTPDRIIDWAEKTGPYITRLVTLILSERLHIQQGFHSCLGILRLCDKYPTERIEAAAARSLYYKTHSYKSFKTILKNGFDGMPLPDDNKELPKVLQHHNIRGSNYYN